jgi:hypothetical protein
MQLTHMLLGLGKMFVPHRQHRLQQDTNMDTSNAGTCQCMLQLRFELLHAAAADKRYASL